MSPFCVFVAATASTAVDDSLSTDQLIRIELEEIRDAPDRLGLEFVFIATSTETPTHPLSAQHGSDRG